MKHSAKHKTDKPAPLFWLAPALVLLVGIVSYANSFGGPFIFDDIDAIQNNPDIKGEPPDPHKEMTTLAGRPVLRLTLIGDYDVAGLNVVAYHATNVAIHLLAALILFGVVRLTLFKPIWSDRFNQSATWLACVVASVWVAHPLTTEAVTYIVQRDESMASLFYLLMVYCFIRAVQSREWSMLWFIGCFAAAIVGMGSKQIVVTAPLILFLYDRTFLAGSFKEALKRRWKIHAGLMATCIFLTVVIISSEKAIKTAGFGLGVTAMQYAITQLAVVARYIRLIFVPTGLILDYDWPVATNWTQITAGGWIVIALGVLTLIALWRKPWLGFIGAWFFFILAPTSSFYPIVTEIAAERRVYLAMAGPIVLAIVAGWGLIKSKPALGAISAIALIMTLSFLTLQRNWQYHTAIGIWTDTVNKQPSNPRAEYNLGYSYAEAGDKETAVQHYAIALKLEPHFYGAAHKLGLTLVEMDKKRAEDFYRKTIPIFPAFAAEAHLRLGQLCYQRNDLEEAKKQFKASIQANPINPDSHQALSLIYIKEGDIAEATKEMELARKVEAEHPR